MKLLKIEKDNICNYFLLATCFICYFRFTESSKACLPVDFGSDSIVCKCNSTYCDYYDDPEPPKKGQFIMYVTSKSGLRLQRSNGLISNDSKDYNTIKIDSAKTYQSIEGFGGAFTDSAGINIKSLSKETQDNLLKSYFGQSGSKYNLGRVPIGGSDFSTRGYTYDDLAGDSDLNNFTLAKEDYYYKIPLMKQALNLNPSLRFLSASWTAPPWMKNRKDYTGFSYLLDEYYQTYANYIVRFLEEYKKLGLNIWAVSTGNEPFTSLIPIVHINSMFWSARSASKWVAQNLGPTLKQSASNDTIILMLDDQRLALPWYMVDVKLFHKNALKYVKGIAVHWYTDSFVPAAVLDITHKLVPDKFILLTEACVGDRPWEQPKVILGSWERAERLVEKLFENFDHWVVGWVDWNLALNTEGGPNWVKNYVDAPIIVDAKVDSFYKQPMYYILAHFSKFIPRDSIKIEAVGKNKDVYVNAFLTRANQIVVLLYNKSSKKKVVNLVDIRTNGTIEVELTEYSLHTILYNGSQ